MPAGAMQPNNTASSLGANQMPSMPPDSSMSNAPYVIRSGFPQMPSMPPDSSMSNAPPFITRSPLLGLDNIPALQGGPTQPNQEFNNFLNRMGGGAGQPQTAPGGKGAGSPAVAPGQTNYPAPGGKSGIGAGQTQPYQPIGGKSAGQPYQGDKGFMQTPGQKGSAPGQKGQPQQAPGMKGGPANGLQPMPGGKGAGHAQPVQGGKGAGQPMQPFHNAIGNDYNVQGGARASSPYSPPGTSGSPAAFGMGPGHAGFGFGNGATRVPDTQHMTAGQSMNMADGGVAHMAVGGKGSVPASNLKMNPIGNGVSISNPYNVNKTGSMLPSSQPVTSSVPANSYSMPYNPTAFSMPYNPTAYSMPYNPNAYSMPTTIPGTMPNKATPPLSSLVTKPVIQAPAVAKPGLPMPAPVAAKPVTPTLAPAPAPATNSLVGTPYPGNAANVTDAQRAAWNAANAPGLIPGSMEWSAKTGIPPY